MKMKILTVCMALTVIAFTSCRKTTSRTIEEVVEKAELRISSSVTAQETRASFDMDTQIEIGEKISVYVDNAGSQIYGNNVLTADGKGGLTGIKMYFPSKQSSVDIYAFHTNAALENNFPAAAVVHTVSTDQTVRANYASSDLLYAAKKNVGFAKNIVDLTFYHMLSKVEVALKVGEGNTDLKGAEVYIVGTKTKADFMPSKASDITNQAARAAMISVTSNSNDAADIKISSDITSAADWANNKYTYNDAVIVPQTVSQGEKFIRVRLANGYDLFYDMATETTFESNKKYSYQITVNLNELVVTSITSNWEAVNPVDGDAEIE